MNALIINNFKKNCIEQFVNCNYPKLTAEEISAKCAKIDKKITPLLDELSLKISSLSPGQSEFVVVNNNQKQYYKFTKYSDLIEKVVGRYFNMTINPSFKQIGGSGLNIQIELSYQILEDSYPITPSSKIDESHSNQSEVSGTDFESPMKVVAYAYTQCNYDAYAKTGSQFNLKDKTNTEVRNLFTAAEQYELTDLYHECTSELLRRK